MTTLTLLFREYCSLCHQMRQELAPLLAEYTLQLNTIDIDDFPELVALYDEKVPVLLAGEEILCHWHLDEAAVRTYCERIRS